MRKEFRSFEDARKIIRSLQLSSIQTWNNYCKSGNKPDNIPSHPERAYKNKGWIDWGDFLGTGRIADQKKKYLTFKEAKDFVHSLGLKNIYEWKKYCKSKQKPDNIPANPYQTYAKNGWKSIPDWLGSKNLSNIYREYVSYEKCQKFVQKLGITKQKEWEKYQKDNNKPDDIPSHPDRQYKKAWKGWGNFLGTGRVAARDRVYLPLKDAKKEAKELAKKYNLKTQSDWVKAHREGKIPKYLPAIPWHVYAKNKRKK